MTLSERIAARRPGGLTRQSGHTLDGRDIYLDASGAMILRPCSCSTVQSPFTRSALAGTLPPKGLDR